ncbi:hypothetical protein L6452_02408 [Arctium lappa]|uniref:Uncharacterized protein n=1 Tax=Arctium lappa TaxID=4217 RepID=A0ACB9FIS1_ARCLA|nr:hypothetical protein L6452_02408 [Arctium lappa]
MSVPTLPRLLFISCQSMDIDVAGWILEFLLRQTSVDDHTFLLRQTSVDDHKTYLAIKLKASKVVLLPLRLGALQFGGYMKFDFLLRFRIAGEDGQRVRRRRTEGSSMIKDWWSCSSTMVELLSIGVSRRDKTGEGARGGSFGGFVEKIGSSIRKSKMGLFTKSSIQVLPPSIDKSRAVGKKKKYEDGSQIEWRKGELIGCGAFGRVYMGMNLDSVR